ncbi:hypothetical protein ACWCXE_31485 [Streptomyces sp. NPDC001780]|uniref:hypothetical protein n=1 Tax=Streptomyces hebeiensis TaxID=229486 RepID=UPI0031DFBB97
MPLKAPATLGRREPLVGVGAAVIAQAAAAPDHVVRLELVDNVETALVDDFVDEGRRSWCAAQDLPPFSDRWSV